ncbi:MAG TPA: pyridoxamine 5'-phosphate oxidase family protein [Candidatus Binataceae bacterium]|nr:pyridoxamine 5'-phosphate oxidase family protein [Candidatus Binataceae bacterium]
MRDGRAATAPSQRVALGRHAERGQYDFETIAAILDEALVCHVGFVVDGQPYVIPTTYARIGHDLYLHGSPVARWIRVLGSRAPLCVTVTLLDGLVLARSAFRHSMNYRSVVVLGRATQVDDPQEKMGAFEALVEHVAPGRWNDGIRHPSDAEIRATMVLRIPLDEASAKMRKGPPLDAEGDLAREVWAGHLPMRWVAGDPIADPALAPSFEIPGYVAEYTRAAK